MGSTGWDFLDTPLGLLVHGTPAVLLRGDGGVERHALPGWASEADDLGRIFVEDPHGNTAYDLRTRRTDVDFDAPDPPAGVTRDWPRSRVDGATQAWADGTGQVIVRQDGVVRRGQVSLPAPKMSATFVEVGGGRVFVVYAPVFRAALGTPKGSLDPDAPYVVVTLSLATLEEEPGARFTRTAALPYRPWRNTGVRGAAWAPEGLYTLVDGQVGRLTSGEWTPIPGLDGTMALHTAPDGTVWAGGTRLWRLRGDARDLVLDALPAEGDPTTFTYDAATGAVARARPGELAFVPRYVERYPFLRPFVRGRGIPAAESAFLADGTRVCGQPAHPAGFVTLFGDCDDWVGLTGLGAVLRGGGAVGAETVEAMAPPVGEARALDRVGDRLYVGGTEALAVWDGTGWSRVPVTSPVDTLSAWRDTTDETIWWAGADLCRLDRAREAAPRCQPLPTEDGAMPLAVKDLVATRAGALAVTNYASLLVATPEGAAPRAVPPDRWQSLLADPVRGVVWALRAEGHGELVALAPETGAALWSWPVPGDAWYARLGDDGAGGLTMWEMSDRKVLRFALDP